jgi:L-ascorbate metabolism protein UlaG (beta-lactamase superfamily)
MRITKLGHCCLLIEEKGLRLLTDPGTYSTAQNEIKDIDVVLITHEHADHLHVESLQTVLGNNPKAQVITNSAVASILKEAGIAHTVLEDKQNVTLAEVLIEALESPHAEIHSTLPRVLNTGFFIAKTLFYPGDAFIEPGKPVDILALPVVGPWMKLSEALEYALKIHPRVAFPVHDGILKQPGMVHTAPAAVLEPAGVHFVPMLEGDTQEF